MNPLDTQLVSVIIPVYNGARYLGEAIESVLAQSYHPSEIIVVDDGSTDYTAKVAQHFESVQYVYQPNSGCGPARNRGVDSAHGAFLAFLDADDLWVNGKLSSQMAAFAAQPDLEAVFGHIQQFYSPDIEPQKQIHAHYAEKIMVGYHADTMVIRSEAFHRVGYFQPEWLFGQFIDWFSRAQEQELKMRLLPNILAKRRIHDTNTGIQKKDDAVIARISILRAALNRRRMNRSDEGMADVSRPKFPNMEDAS